MSTYRHTQKPDRVITLGFDPVFKRFFLVVETEEDEEGPFYSNLDDSRLKRCPEFYTDISYFKAKAESLGVTVIPEETWEKMIKDQTSG